MKTLHFFSEYYYPAYNSTSFYITKIIHACANVWKGNMCVYCATDNPGPEQLQNSNVKIIRFKGGRMNKNNLVSRLLKFVLITLKFSGVAFCKINKGDTVFSITNPAFMLVFLAFLRKIRNFRFVLLVYDIFPEVLIPGGLVKAQSVKYRVVLKIFNWAYNSADTLIVIGRDMQEVVEKKTLNPSKIVFIPNWSDTENIFPVQKKDNPILKRLGIENKFIFSIAGNMGRTQGLENILDVFNLNCLKKNSVFLFMGGGAKLESIKKEIKKNNLQNVKVTGWIPEEEQNSMLSACDVAVISLAEGMYGLSVPSKSYFNMAAKKPLLLIANLKSEIARVIQENEMGWVVHPCDPEALAKTLLDIQNLPLDTLARYGRNARKTAEEKYCEKKILAQFVNTICF